VRSDREGERRRERKKRDARHAEDLKSTIFDDRVFDWNVSTVGYVWMNARHGGDIVRVLTDGAAIDRKRPPNSYQPLLIHGLFDKFAGLQSDEEEIRQFANMYGMLYGAPVEFKTPSGSSSLQGETFTDWTLAIEQMNRALELWKWSMEGEKANLNAVLQWDNPHKEYPKGSWRYYTVKPVHLDFLHLHAWDWLTPTSLAPAGLSFVQCWINEQLAKHCPTGVLWDRDKREYVPRVTPRNLLGAMWWQFARMFFGEIDYRPCRICGALMEISKEARRSDSEICSSTCRQRDHRRKVKEAKRLQAAGESIREIANQLKTKSSVIQHWLRNESEDHQ
jgi:hypothetical protein